MGRVHVWNFLRDEDGSAIASADISIYLAGSTTPATVYLNEMGGTTIGNAPHLRSNTEGYFEFWIGDDSEINGYNTTQKFKIAWDKIGINTGYIDYVEAFPPVIPVDITDSGTTLNKSVSNFMGKTWSDHVSNLTHIAHGIDEVDPASNNTVTNKLVSNALAQAWSAATIPDTFNFSTGSIPTSAQGHGITQLNPVSTDAIRNKLVCNLDIKQLNDHTSATYTTSPHGFAAADETSTDTTPNKLVSNKQLKDIKGTTTLTYTKQDIVVGDWTLNGSVYELTVTHNLGQNYPMIQLWRRDTGIQVIPVTVTNLTINSIKLTVTSAFTAAVRCSI